MQYKLPLKRELYVCDRESRLSVVLMESVLVFEQEHDKNNKICMPSKDSDQPGHLPSLISLHCALYGKPRTPIFFRQTVTQNFFRRTAQTGHMPRLIWVFTGHIGNFVGFVVFRLILIKTYIMWLDCTIFCTKIKGLFTWNRVWIYLWNPSLLLWLYHCVAISFKSDPNHYNALFGFEDIPLRVISDCFQSLDSQ